MRMMDKDDDDDNGSQCNW